MTREASERRWQPRDAPPAFDDIAAKLLEPSLPFGRLYTALLEEFLEPQRLFLEWCQKAAADRSLDEATEEYLRQMMKAMMGAYLDIMKSLPEHRERLADIRNDLVRAYLDGVNELLRRVHRPRA